MSTPSTSFYSTYCGAGYATGFGVGSITFYSYYYALYLLAILIIAKFLGNYSAFSFHPTGVLEIL
jgi:hypothetical protein